MLVFACDVFSGLKFHMFVYLSSKHMHVWEHTSEWISSSMSLRASAVTPPAAVFTSSYEQRCNEVLFRQHWRPPHYSCIMSAAYFPLITTLPMCTWGRTRIKIMFSRTLDGLCSIWLLLLKLQLCVYRKLMENSMFLAHLK